MSKKCPNCGACPECGARPPYSVRPTTYPYWQQYPGSWSGGPVTYTQSTGTSGAYPPKPTN